MTLSGSLVQLTLNSTLCVPTVGYLGALEGCMGLEVQTPREKNGVFFFFLIKKINYYGENFKEMSF